MAQSTPRTLARALAICIVGVAGGCGAGGEDESAGRVAEGFYSAVASKDGPRACAQLSESTLSELEQEEMAPCREAVTELKLSGSTVERSTVYVTSALVELRGGDHVFLDKTPQGWKVSAAGCKPQPGEEQPDDCEVES
jgi:hypothetical protein